METRNCATCTNRTRFDSRRAFPGVMSAECYLTTVQGGTVSVLERSGRYFYASSLSEITSCLLWTDKPSRYAQSE